MELKKKRTIKKNIFSQKGRTEIPTEGSINLQYRVDDLKFYESEGTEEEVSSIVYFKFILTEEKNLTNKEIEELLKTAAYYLDVEYEVTIVKEKEDKRNIRERIKMLLEPYIKHEVLIFQEEVNMPFISLPFNLWKEMNPDE